MRKHIMVLAALAALTAAPALGAVSAADKQFATEAAQGGLAEVEMGQLAVQKANSPQVKQFAQRMVTDHTHANEELVQLAKAQNTDLCPARRQTQSELDQLRGANGTAFATIDTVSGN